MVSLRRRQAPGLLSAPPMSPSPPARIGLFPRAPGDHCSLWKGPVSRFLSSGSREGGLRIEKSVVSGTCSLTWWVVCGHRVRGCQAFSFQIPRPPSFPRQVGSPCGTPPRPCFLTSGFHLGNLWAFLLHRVLGATQPGHRCSQL